MEAMMDEVKDTKKTIKFEIQADEETAMGVYSNFMVINASETEFALDFIYIPPQSNKAKLRSRVLMSPAHLKRMAILMQKQIEIYERKFGEIALNRYKLEDPFSDKEGGEGKVH